jgi:hypothetical protein
MGTEESKAISLFTIPDSRFPIPTADSDCRFRLPIPTADPDSGVPTPYSLRCRLFRFASRFNDSTAAENAIAK